MAEVEEWREVPDTDGRYQASSLGRVRVLPRWVNGKNNRPRLTGMKVLSDRPNGFTGYVEVAVHRADGTIKRTSAHSLVCAAFHGPRPSPAYQAAHGDGSKTNNRPDNLRWVTAKENAADRAKHGRDPVGEDHYNTPLKAADVIAIRGAYRPGYGNLAKLGRQYNLTRAAVLQIVKRGTWKHI